jgi:hypothetical protein
MRKSALDSGPKCREPARRRFGVRACSVGIRKSFLRMPHLRDQQADIHGDFSQHGIFLHTASQIPPCEPYLAYLVYLAYITHSQHITALSLAFFTLSLTKHSELLQPIKSTKLRAIHQQTIRSCFVGRGRKYAPAAIVVTKEQQRAQATRQRRFHTDITSSRNARTAEFGDTNRRR